MELDLQPDAVLEGVMREQPPLRASSAVKAIASCALRTAELLGRRRLHQPADHVGRRCSFADGTSATIYRETVIDLPATKSPAVLVVSFRLRRVRSRRAHALFRLESVLNTVLFAGFPGLVSKLWLAHDEHGVYRGLYEWDDPLLAEDYVRALWWVLALVSVRSSIHYAVLPGLHRDDLLRDPHVADGVAVEEPQAWWRLTATGASAR
jgi:hypothetical protein